MDSGVRGVCSECVSHEDNDNDNKKTLHLTNSANVNATSKAFCRFSPNIFFWGGFFFERCVQYTLIFQIYSLPLENVKWDCDKKTQLAFSL